MQFKSRLADLASGPGEPHTIDGIVLTKMDAIDEKARLIDGICRCILALQENLTSNCLYQLSLLCAEQGSACVSLLNNCHHNNGTGARLLCKRRTLDSQGTIARWPLYAKAGAVSRCCYFRALWCPNSIQFSLTICR